MNQFKKKLTAFSALLALIAVSSSVASADPTPLGIGDNTVLNKTYNMEVGAPTGGVQKVTLKSVTNGAVGQVDWGRMNVASGETMRFGFSGMSQTIINRVLGGEKSSFYGNLISGCSGGNCPTFGPTGKVVIINPAGILFGAGSVVDINSLTATTFDFRGAKNLSSIALTSDEAAAGITQQMKDDAYLSTLPTKLQRHDTGDYYYNSKLVFDRNVTENFAGITPDHHIEINGAAFDHNNGNGINTNNLVAMVSDKITYRDSLIRVGANRNYFGNNSYGKISLVTADGAQFEYLSSGAEDKHVSSDNATGTAAKPEIERTIDIDNNASIAGAPATKGLYSGDITIENKSAKAGSNIKISNTYIKADKFESDQNGNIYIIGSNDVEVKNSTLTTKNVDSINAKKRYGGEVYIKTNDNITLDNVKIRTAGATQANIDKTGLDDSGSVRLFSTNAAGKTISVSDSEIASEGNMQIITFGDISVDNSLIQAKNNTSADYVAASGMGTELVKDIKFYTEHGDIDITDSRIYSSNDISIITDKVGLTEDKTSQLTLEATTGNKNVIQAEKDITLGAKEILVDDTVLSYDTLTFETTYDATDTLVASNVTFKDGTAFDPGHTTTKEDPENAGSFIIDNAGSTDIVITNAGNITFSNATAKKAKDVKIAVTKDDTTYGNVSSAASYTTENANSLTATSTKSNVSAIETTNIVTNDYITFNAMNTEAGTGNISVINSALTANNDAQNATTGAITFNSHKDGLINNSTITAKDIIGKAKGGTLRVIDGSRLIAANDITLDTFQDNSTIAGSKVADRYIEIKGSDLDAANDVTISSRGNITISENGVGGTYQDSAVKAGNDVNITNQGALTIAISAKNGDTTKKTVQAGRNVNITNTVTGTNIGKITIADKATIVSDGKLVTVPEAATAEGTTIPEHLEVVGSVNINSAADVNFVNGTTPATSYIDKSTSIISAKDININSLTGSIKGDKANLGTIQYGSGLVDEDLNPVDKGVGALTFNAKVNNEFTSADSLKAVNVNYIAEGNNKITATDDIQFVNVTFKGVTNEITSDDDIVINGVNIDAATTKTNILAGGDVTTYDVTGTTATDIASGHSYLNNVNVTHPTTNTTDTVLAVNGTKVYVETKAVQDAARPDKGSVHLNTSGTVEAKGLDIVARNWKDVTRFNKNAAGNAYDIDTNDELIGHDGNPIAIDDNGQLVDTDNATYVANAATTTTFEPVWDAAKDATFIGKDANDISYGPVVSITSADESNTVAISKIVTDKLKLGSTKVISSPIADDDHNGMVNLTESNYLASGSDRFYTTTASSIDPAQPKGYIEVKDQGGFDLDPTDDTGKYPTDISGLPFSYTANFNQVPDEGTSLVWTTDHYISFNDSDNANSDFILIYNRPDVCAAPPVSGPPSNPPINEAETASVISVFDLEPPVPTERTALAARYLTLPQEDIQVSDSYPITYGIAERTGRIFAAAAGITTDEDETDETSN